MNLLLLAGAVSASGGLPPINLTNTTIFADEDNGEIGKSGIYINIDGTTDSLLSVFRTQINVATDWIIPNVLADDLISRLEVKWDHVSGSTGLGENIFAAEGTYVDLDEDRLYSIRKDDDDTDVTEVIDITLRLDSTDLFVGRYTLRILHDPA